MRQSACLYDRMQSTCLCDRVHAWWLTQSRLTTSLFNCRRNEGSGLNMFNTVGWGSMLCFGRAHWGSTVGYLLLQRFSKGLVVEFLSCCNSVLLDLDLYDRRIRSPSREPHTLYVFEPQQNIGRGFFNVKPI